MDAPLLTPQELADRLNVPLNTVRKWRSIRTGPPVLKVGRHLRYRPEDVQAWLNEQTAQH